MCSRAKKNSSTLLARLHAIQCTFLCIVNTVYFLIIFCCQLVQLVSANFIRCNHLLKEPYGISDLCTVMHKGVPPPQETKNNYSSGRSAILLLALENCQRQIEQAHYQLHGRTYVPGSHRTMPRHCHVFKSGLLVRPKTIVFGRTYVLAQMFYCNARSLRCVGRSA